MKNFLYENKTVFNNAHQRKQIKIFGIKLTFKTKEYLENSNKYNVEQNKINLSFNKPALNNNILFVASNFVKQGGIETRLKQYIEKLTENNFNVFVLSEDNRNEFLSKQTNFYLSFDAPNFNNCLIEIIKEFNINYIEFQFKNSKILKKLNLDVIKKYSVVGCTLHNTGIKNINLINKLDYKIVVSNFLYKNHYKKIINPAVIQNSIDFSRYDNDFWKFKNQNTALLISRLMPDKLNSIECFVKYCMVNGCKFKIAGEDSNFKIKEKLKNKFNLADDVFIGAIDTVDYLKENKDKYLFIAGVGLVILEAGAFNIPCFVCSDDKNKCYSFVTKENVELFDNFTINARSLVAKCQKKEFELDKNNLEKYKLKNYFVQKRDLENNFKRYQNLLTEKCKTAEVRK